MSQPKEHPWDVLLLGGASGTGKTSVSYRLARHFDVGITEIDDLFIVAETITTPEHQPMLHYWGTKPESVVLSAEQILEHHISVSRVLVPALEAVVANHVETSTPVVLEGDYVLPELVAKMRQNFGRELERVRAVFLYESDEGQIVRNFGLREPEEGEQSGRARASWLYGEWLRKECERYGLNAMSARPWNSLFDRIVEVLD